MSGASEDQVFLLPDLGEGLTEAEVVQWHVAVGDTVTVDQEVVTVETAKAAVTVPCPYAGTVAVLHGETGDTLDVGRPLVTIRSGGAAPAGGRSDATASPTVSDDAVEQGAGAEQYRTEERAGTSAPDRPLIGYGAAEPARRRQGSRRRGPGRGAPAPASTVPAPASPDSEATPSPKPETAQAIKVISPLVRRLAAEAGVDLAAVRTDDPTGVIRRADVDRAISSTAPPAEPTRQSAGQHHDREPERIPITGVRRLIADKLSRSRREIPDATTWVDVDATALLDARDALRRAYPDAGIGILALLARITVAGLARFPELNASVDEDEIVRYRRVNLGFAAESPRGLVVPVIHDADLMDTTELAAQLRRLTQAAREGTVEPSELVGGTFTLNNYGVFGVDGSTPIINHPEAGMLGVGRIIDRPWAHDGQLALRKVTQLSLTFDHRVCDGGTAGGFLRFVADAVEAPTVLLAGA